MFYSQVILAKKGPLAKVWMAANWGDKKLARPQIFATDISQSCTDIMNPSVPFALRLSGQLLLGVVRIYSRKVKYVLNDCTEAMLKLQMAFTTKASSSSSGGAGGGTSNTAGRELLTDQDVPTNNLVTNFGEYDQVHVVEGFCLPLPEENEWILAEDEDDVDAMDGTANNNGRGGGQQQQRTLLLTAHLPRSSQRSPSGGGGGIASSSQPFATPEEETWAPFDPENEDDDEDDVEDGQKGQGRSSRVSDIEIVRAANDSLLSDDQTRRTSSILDKSDDLPGGFARGTGRDDPARGGRGDEEDFDMSHIPFDDDSMEGEQPAPTGTTTAFDPTVDDSMLQLSHDGSHRANRRSTNTNLSGLDDSDAQTTPGSNKRTADDLEQQQQQQPPPQQPRRRKRRKVVIDNHRTELSNEQIKAMLQDTSDIVRRMVPPGSVWREDDDDDEMGMGTTSMTQNQQQQHQQLGKLDLAELTRPFLADEEFKGGPRLHSRLRKLWTDNFYNALGQPCPFRQEKSTDHDDDDDVEHVRRNQVEEEDEKDGSTVDQSEFDVPPVPDEGGGPRKHPEQSQEDDFEMPAVDDDDDEEEMEPADGGQIDFEEEQEDQEDAVGFTHAYARGHLDELDLGLVNELEVDEDEEDDQEDRQAVGDVSSSTTKWHKHTVRVLQHLQQNMRDPDRNREGGNDDDYDNEEYENLPDHLQFQQISKNVSSRRNAASVFFELLQLKTWDFIELDQSEAYGDITITPGVRFHESPPNSK